MSSEVDDFTTGHQKKMKPHGEPNRRSSKRRRSATVIHDVHVNEMENEQPPPEGFSSKYVPPEPMNMAEGGIPPNQLDSLSDDSISLGKDELVHKPGSSDTPVEGTKHSSVSVDDPRVTAMSSMENVPNTWQISPAMAQKINDDIKYQLMKEVRKFGRNYEKIFVLLEKVQGDSEVKKQFVEFTIKEATRFKRFVLIQQLKKIL
ncbi:integrator complex subunit 6-like [Microcebus murinus]|uniref:integrator complex subunit 6-like n=1 Tax=Microcebus murinus TaxID=30608 RepID=UPI0006438F1A|nr:sarcoma antigen 1-like [Microcebus murinus]